MVHNLSNETGKSYKSNMLEMYSSEDVHLGSMETFMLCFLYRDTFPSKMSNLFKKIILISPV